MSNLSVLARHLLHLGIEANVCFNNKHIVHITHYRTFSPGTPEPEPDCIYIVFGSDAAERDRLLSRCVNLLIIGAAPHSIDRHIGPETNVIFVNGKVPFSVLHSTLQSCCEAFSTWNACSEMTLQAALQKDSVSDFISVCAEMFNSNVLLLQDGDRVLAAGKPPGGEDFTVNAEILDILNKKEYEWLPGTPDDFSYPSAVRTEDGTNLLITSFCPDGHSAYKLCIVSVGADFAASDYPLASRATEMVIRLLNFGALPERVNSFVQFFEKTVSTTNANSSVTLSRAAAFDFRPDGDTYMYMIYPSVGSRDCGRISPHDSERQPELVRITDTLKASVRGIIFPYRFSVILLSEEPHGSCTSAIKEILKREGPFWKFARSMPLNSALELKRAYSECLNAQRISFHYRRGENFFPYEYVSAQLMLLRYQDLSDDIADYALPTAKEIIDYDDAHGTDYRTTLALYIKSFRNIQKTADELHVHRNTIHFRLQKLSELFDIDFEDCGLLTAVGFSFDIYESISLRKSLSRNV